MNDAAEASIQKLLNKATSLPSDFPRCKKCGYSPRFQGEFFEPKQYVILYPGRDQIAKDSNDLQQRHALLYRRIDVEPNIKISGVNYSVIAIYRYSLL